MIAFGRRKIRAIVRDEIEKARDPVPPEYVCPDCGAEAVSLSTSFLQTAAGTFAECPEGHIWGLSP